MPPVYGRRSLKARITSRNPPMMKRACPWLLDVRRAFSSEMSREVRVLAGLDPLSASGIDELVLNLRDALGLTIMMVTHDLDLLWRVADRVAVLDGGNILGVGTMDELSQSEHPLIREYFYGPRGRAAQEQTWKKK